MRNRPRRGPRTRAMKRCEAERARLSRQKVEQVRTLRREATDEERALWKALRARQRGVKWRRSHPILGWVVDLYCPACRLVIEVDGGVHDTRRPADAERDAVMRRAGLDVIRVRNVDVTTALEAVLAHIDAAVAARRG